MADPREPASAPAPPHHAPVADQSWPRAFTWIPSLYFVQGLPYVLVNFVSVVMYKEMGVSNTEIAFYTSWLGLIWAFKALWSPLVDGLGTKRGWTIAMQGLMVPALVAVALALPASGFLQLTLLMFGLVAVFSATHDIAADGLYMLGLNEGQQSAFVGVRSTFWRAAWIAGEGGLVVLGGLLANRLGLVQGWGATMVAAAGIIGVAALYHAFVLPRPAADRPRDRSQALQNSAAMVRSFLAKPGLVKAILFLFFFRFAESHLSKLVSPFLLDEVSVGGLGLSPEAVGTIKGTVGLIFLTVGGILGGVAIFAHGLRAWLWPMVVALNVPNLVYVYLAWMQPENMVLVTALLSVEQFGYGFGLAAYLMFMIHLASGEYKTAHYAFATGIMALAAFAAQAWSGWMQEQLGYDWFFVWVCALTLLGVWVSAIVDIPPRFGKGGT